MIKPVQMSRALDIVTYNPKSVTLTTRPQLVQKRKKEIRYQSYKHGGNGVL